jgi:membrane-bound metal-dependent hydrolase YbcI (DUF457 family)
MNTLFHILVNYFILRGIFGPAVNSYIPVMIIASAVLDLDHIPYLIRNFRNILKKGIDHESRSLFHEFAGLVIVTVFSAAFYLLSKDKALPVIISVSLYLHLIVDFLVGDSRPFHPFSERVVKSPLGLTTRKKRIAFEIIAVVFTLMLITFVK